MVHRKHQWSHKAVGSRLEMKKPEFIFNVIEQAFLDFNCLSPKMGTLNPRVYYHHHARWNGSCGVCTVSGQTQLPSCACLPLALVRGRFQGKQGASELVPGTHQCRASNIKFIQVGVWKAHHAKLLRCRGSTKVLPWSRTPCSVYVPVVMQSFPNRARRPKQGTAVGAYVSNGMSYRQWEAKPGFGQWVGEATHRIGWFSFAGTPDSWW